MNARGVAPERTAKLDIILTDDDEVKIHTPEKRI